MRETCDHLGEIRKVTPSARGCEECLKIANKQLNDSFERNIVPFMDLVEAAKHYPCDKKAWIEFLGEQLNAATARVE